MALQNINGRLVPVAGLVPPQHGGVSPPVMQPMGGVGGGTATPRALDPAGLVPVSRPQPLNTTPSALAAQRMAAMPPSSFAGAGKNIAPVSTNPGLAPAPSVYNPATVATDTGPVVTPTIQAAPLSAQAVADTANQQSLYGGSPTNPPADPRLADWQARRSALLAKLQERLPPDAFARVQQRFADIDARRAAQFQNRGANLRSQLPLDHLGIATPADRVRAMLANHPQVQQYIPQGLLGVTG